MGSFKSQALITADGSPSVKEDVRQLKQLAIAVVAGTTANTNIAVAFPAATQGNGGGNIKTTAVLLAVLDMGAAFGAIADITSTVTIPSAGNIQSTNVTTGHQLLVIAWNIDALGTGNLGT